MTLLILVLLPLAIAWLVALQASPREMYPLVGAMYGLWTAIAWTGAAIALAVAVWPASPDRQGHQRVRWTVAVAFTVGATLFTWNLLRLPVPDGGLHGENATAGRDLLSTSVEGLLSTWGVSVGQATMTPCEDALGRAYGATRVNLDDIEFTGSVFNTDDLDQLVAALEDDGWTVTTRAQPYRGVDGLVLDADKGPYHIGTSPVYPKGTDFVSGQPWVTAWSACLSD